MWQRRWFWYSASCCWFALLLQSEGKVQICISNSFKQLKQHQLPKCFFLYFKYLFIRIVIQCSLYLCVYLFCLIQRQKEPKFTFKTHSSNSIYTLAKLQFMVPWFDIKRPNGVKNVSVILCWHLCVQELKFECEIIFGNAFSGVLCVQRSCEKDSNLKQNDSIAIDGELEILFKLDTSAILFNSFKMMHE